MVNRDLNSNLTFLDLRKDYDFSSLEEEKVASSPFEQFERWFTEILQTKIIEPNAMVLSTCGKDEQPSSRVVLMKGFSRAGIKFFSNYESRKAQELEENCKVSLLFYWGELERQVRIQGVVQKVEREESLGYFEKRPRDAQVAAIVSKQSRTLLHRTELEEEIFKYQSSNQKPELPKHWGGYLVIPNYFEFWQGRKSRLHDRIVYQQEDVSKLSTQDSESSPQVVADCEIWKISRLYP